MVDEPELIDRKSRLLAEAFKQSKSVAVYTGAGISTVSVFRLRGKILDMTSRDCFSVV